jgi:peptidyl-prolyl cis-trans isomerase B (cyclophilin B)
VRGVRLDQRLRSAVSAEEKRLAAGENRPAAFLGPTPAEFPPIPPPREHEARLITPHGTIMITLFTDVAPVAVANFVRLARSGFYDRGVFHRVVPNFVVQGGCPRHDGYGGPGYALPAEVSPEEYSVGTLGMADAGLDTAGSQFFLTLSPTPRLEGRYTAFGRVTAGLAVLEQIQIGDWFRVEIMPPDSEAPGSEGASERESDAR